ncbi:MAG: cytochrome b/b6 domain-containing protein [Bacteroidales bacterium]|nr:cytochrome b/b6 domain-containing protein [Bacteroidales bacterium]
MAEKLYLYPKWLRIWHGFNALLILALIVTGVSMQYSSPEYGFIPFDKAVSIHNIAGMLLTLNYILFVVGNMVTPNGRYYKITKAGFFRQTNETVPLLYNWNIQARKTTFPCNQG